MHIAYTFSLFSKCILFCVYFFRLVSVLCLSKTWPSSISQDADINGNHDLLCAFMYVSFLCLACVSHLRKDRGDQDSDVTENHELLCAVLGVIADLHVILALQPPESSVSHQPSPSDAAILSSIQREQCEPGNTMVFFKS